MKKPLSAFIREYSARNKNEACSAVYSVTNSHGFMPSTEYFSKEVFSKDLSTYKIVKKGMIAYNPSRINVGSVAVQRTAEQVIVSPLYVVFEVNEKELLPEYVSYFLHSDIGLAQIAMNTSGSVRDSLKFNALQKIEINVYSVEEQRRVVDKLQRLEAIILKKRKVLEKFEDLVKSQFIEMFGDPNLNSKSLPTNAMTEVCDIIDGDRGVNYPKQEEFTSDGYCLFLSAKNVTKEGFLFEECIFISKEKDHILRNGKLTRGDVVLTTRGTIGNLAFYTDCVPYQNVRINSGMVILRMRSTILNEQFFIQQFRLQLDEIKRKIASGSAQPQLPISTMKKIKMLLPPIELQNQFAAFVEQTDKSKFRIKQSLEKLEKCYKALLQKYFG